MHHHLHLLFCFFDRKIQSYGFRIPVLPSSLSRDVETIYRPIKNALIKCIFGGTGEIRTPVHRAFTTKDTLSGWVQQFYYLNLCMLRGSL